jgi:hypothetical protein
MTRATDSATLPPLSGRHPTRLVARDNIAWWSELDIVTAYPGTAKCDRLGLPNLIMPMGLAHQSMRNLMQNRVVNRLVCSRVGIRVREGDDPRTIVAAARAFRGVVKLETPALELVCHEPRGGTRRYGLELAVRALWSRGAVSMWRICMVKRA